MVELNHIAQTLRDASDEYGIYELGVFHIRKTSSESSEPFILVGVNPNNEDAVSVFDDWQDRWFEYLEHIDISEYEEDDIDTEVHEFRFSEAVD